MTRFGFAALVLTLAMAFASCVRADDVAVWTKHPDFDWFRQNGFDEQNHYLWATINVFTLADSQIEECQRIVYPTRENNFTTAVAGDTSAGYLILWWVPTTALENNFGHSWEFRNVGAIWSPPPHGKNMPLYQKKKL